VPYKIVNHRQKISSAFEEHLIKQNCQAISPWQRAAHFEKAKYPLY
jgi:hypothetical protein